MGKNTIVLMEGDKPDSGTATEYARNRRDDYPTWEIQLDKIYHDGVDKWKTEMIDPVKTKWPKDNSGPI